MEYLAIVGSRSFVGRDDEIMKVIEDFLLSKQLKDFTIVSGGARGIDSIAVKYAIKHSISYIEYLPDWNKHGKSAGFRRNSIIVDRCSMMLAIWDGNSGGTLNSIYKVIAANKPCYILEFNPHTGYFEPRSAEDLRRNDV
jgi:hypothetical protein